MIHIYLDEHEPAVENNGLEAINFTLSLLKANLLRTHSVKHYQVICVFLLIFC